MNDQIAHIAEQAIADRAFPGCVVGVIRDGQRTVLPFGHLTYEATAPAVQAETFYDVASLTKSIPTAAIILQLIDQGKLRLDSPVIDYLPEVANDYREQILLKHLLTYTVVLDIPEGLSSIAHKGVDELRRVILTSPLQAPPGQTYHYTNAPAIWLGWIAERVCGQPLDQIAEEVFFAPLGMNHTTFHPESLAADAVAPTEREGDQPVHRLVHDEAARTFYRAGEVVGNAGLFATADDLLTFADLLLAGGDYHGQRYFSPQIVTQMHTNQLAELGVTTGLGWEMGQPQFMGESASDQAFAKTGFSGCFIMIDPIKQAAFVLLCNHIYPVRPADRTIINNLRRCLAEVIIN